MGPRQIWRGPEIGPFPATAPAILIGGFAPAALRRVARHADGFLCAAPLTDPAEIAATVAAYRDFGADELVLYCYADDPAQVEELAGVVRLAE